MNLTSMYDSLRSRYNLTEVDHELIMLNMPEMRQIMNEEMVAGDSGGSVENIASGVTTGAITNKGPKVLGSTRPYKRKRKIMKDEPK
ncbi:MAG: hypothetical protein RR212_10235 [Bacteroidales bacterium]